MINDDYGPHGPELVLPPVPRDQRDLPVAAWDEPLQIQTYEPCAPDVFPAFLDRRVYQGSSGRVYPLPFHERVAAEPVQRAWQAVHLENEWVRLTVLPELGGRIHIGYDKVAGYDFFYRNNVIKPALVGLAGPWVSGGVEFNWPQHHRPATFLPTDWCLEREADGSVTVWCSDHDPMQRMKGMHGIRLRPDSTVVEARVRLHNRTDVPQTFLWWANVAAAVGDNYQSFFPTDVTQVADHAKRAVTTFPAAAKGYYGVDYPGQVSEERPDGDRLDWYRNIPVPTSYMVTATSEEFFGGYDHGRRAGFVHWADRAISPGKKQWTWGNAPFGRAWDANLTDGDGPYVELMAGVYTDNQPDFAWLAPGETKSFSQFWFPIREIGPAHLATLDLAARVEADPADDPTRTILTVALQPTRSMPDARITLSANGRELVSWPRSLGVGQPARLEASTEGRFAAADLTLEVTVGGREVVRWKPPLPEATKELVPATEPPAPEDVATVEELYLLGAYLEQYRHATRRPDPYFSEGLRRDAGDVRCNLALGARLERAGLFAGAQTHFREALVRLVQWAPTPVTGEAQYRLGLSLTRKGHDTQAVPLLERAAWDAAWRAPSTWLLARIAARAGDLERTAHHADVVRRLDPDHLGATCLAAMAARLLGGAAEAEELLRGQLAVDPLHQWTRDLAGLELTRDATTLLDVALDYAGCGALDDAARLLMVAAKAAGSAPRGQVQVAPLVEYHRASVLRRLGRPGEADLALERAGGADGTYCLASRLEDVAVLEEACSLGPDPRAELLLGSWFYDAGREQDAVAAWQRALAAGPDRQTAVLAHRNLGIASVNVEHDEVAALVHYEAARALAPRDAKLLHEHDQLLARSGNSSLDRLEALLGEPELVSQRDDLSVVLADLLTGAGRQKLSQEMLAGRRFHPWEGGEGAVLAAWDRCQLSLARGALADGDAGAALGHVRAALDPPASLGEARHPLANAAELHVVLGQALRAGGDDAGAALAWEQAAAYSGDFSGMSTRAHSTQTAWSVRALRALGRREEADVLLSELMAYTEVLARTPASIDYFATSLPTMLLFHTDPQQARDQMVEQLRDQIRELGAP